MGMKLYTLHTPSHQELYENYFLPSLVGEYEHYSEIRAQECPTGSYLKPGWNMTTYRKAQFFLEKVKENYGITIVFSDVDIQFLGPTKELLLEELGDYDIAAQDDTQDMMCSGFFICKCNDATVNMFTEMVNNFFKVHEAEDQKALNNHRHMVKWKYLSHRFFTIKHTLGRVWDGEMDIVVPSDIVMHHANWTISVSNKMALLGLVKSKFYSHG